MRRVLRKVCTIAIVMVVVAGLAQRADASTLQIGSFQSGSGLYTYNNGSITGTTTGPFTYDSAFAALFGLPITTFSGATLQISTTAAGATTQIVAPTGTTLFQAMNGYIMVTDSSNNILVRADFTNAFLSGVVGSQIVTLTGSTINGGTVVYSGTAYSNFIGAPSFFNFDLNPTSLAVALNGLNFRNFTAPDIANFSTTVQTPEPAALALFGLSLTLAGALARKRRRKSDESA